MPLRSSKVIAPLLAGSALLLASCARDEVSHFRVPKSASDGAAPSMPGRAPPPGMAGDVELPPEPDQGLRWTLPRGWSEKREGGGMRYATLTPPMKGLEATVVVLSGQAGGELMNVNRWRGQIQLGPVDEAALATARQPVKSKAGEVRAYDFTSDDKKSRLIAGILDAGGSSWFFKVKGDAAAVAAARQDFLTLLGSIRLE